ncbi:hypothetical protein [Bacteroidetes bacterium endosymbiont of Geopemphigus sp.]|uniref:hypothetical protein n=2 Tax=Bacteroidetes bacterium endosymbiont of Geopemphigus sp. TaxID=2047937 RepID=UPI003D2F68EA
MSGVLYRMMEYYCIEWLWQKKITHEQALIKIQETVKEWNKILDDKKLLYLQGIGHFENSGNNRWVFHPEKDINFPTESFRLSPVKAFFPLCI